MLGLVATQVAVRIGTLRSFAQVELQASTDVLTGLPNRRATEDHLDRALRSGDRVEVPPKTIPFFKPSKELRDVVNGGPPPPAEPVTRS